jgi:hypothetical protein
MRSDRLAEPGTIGCLAERVGFEPTCPLLAGKTLSRRPRYDHFGTSPAIDSLSDRIRDSLRYRAIRSSMDRNIIHSSCTALMEQWFNGSMAQSLRPRFLLLRKNSRSIMAQSAAITPLTTPTR